MRWSRRRGRNETLDNPDRLPGTEMAEDDMSDDMGMAEEAINDALVESAGYEDGCIELRRAPGICCPEPSCDHGFHGKMCLMMPHEKAKLECEGCGKACANCEVRPCQLR